MHLLIASFILFIGCNHASDPIRRQVSAQSSLKSFSEPGVSMGDISPISTRKIHLLMVKNAQNVLIGEITINGMYKNSESHENSDLSIPSGPASRKIISELISFSSVTFVGAREATEGERAKLVKIVQGLQQNKGHIKINGEDLSVESPKYQEGLVEYLKSEYNFTVTFS